MRLEPGPAGLAFWSGGNAKDKKKGNRAKTNWPANTDLGGRKHEGGEYLISPN